MTKLEPTNSPEESVARMLRGDKDKAENMGGGENQQNIKNKATLLTDENDAAELEALLAQLAKNPEAAAMLNQLLREEAAGDSANLPFPNHADATADTLGRLNLNINNTAPSSSLSANDMMSIKPRPGIVIKTHLTKPKQDYPLNMKVFINLCHSPDIPPPPTMDYEEVSRAMLAQDNVSFKVPLSLSHPKLDKDKAGTPCLVFDAACNTTPYQHSIKNGSFHAFMVTLCCEWIEAKHDLFLSRDVTFPKLKAKGEISTHMIRKQSKTIISELPKSQPKPSSAVSTSRALNIDKNTADTLENQKTLSSSQKSESDIISPAVLPFHEIFLEPAGSAPEFIVVRISLPQLPTIKENVNLDVEEEILLLEPVKGSIASKTYKPLVVELAAPIVLDEVGAQFDLSTRVLTITLVCTK
ncbi:PIH1 domain-containing protein 1 [Physocladia obscura]|uniref:PIH1 domain-containing protein 1 n=1 Tax=Physocladia obscura TaxID=109957 RepID=A0AAD5XM54_9FUNG|nr:PIH1 domain-containing protein 1 [Physocladia obscura]